MSFRSRVLAFLKNPAVALGLAGIFVYRKILSPTMHAVFGAKSFCRFSPTCSEFARQALLKHGFFAGTALATWRILRCNPFCRCGFDPVPEKGEPLFRCPRIGIFGGSFDPVHVAHLTLAETARKTLRLDRVIFVPAAHSPLKNSAPKASDKQRLEMLRGALDGVPATEISDWEISRGGESYSIETVRHFEEIFPRAKFFWIFGADQLAKLDRWFCAETLCQKVVFAAACRDGNALPPVPERLRGIAKIVPVPLPRIDLSSTEIREKISRAAFDEIRNCLPAKVLTIIREQKIYQTNHANAPKIDDKKSESERQIEADKSYEEPCWNDR